MNFHILKKEIFSENKTKIYSGQNPNAIMIETTEN